MITTCNLVPAGTHRGRSVVDTLISAKGGGQNIEEVVWDPGYSLCKPESTSVPLAQAGIVQTFQPVTHQRGSRPFSGEALLIDGQLFSPHLPEELRHLPAPPRGASEAEKIVYEAKFNQRARWRLVRHAGPDVDGVTRWRCPFCAGLLRSRQVPKTMRTSRKSPLVLTPEGSTSCCSGILSAVPAELPLAQRIPYGTTAWRISMGRRQVVESVNAALKGSFVDLTRGFFRVFGRVKITVLLGFTLAAFNLERIRSFRSKHRFAEEDRSVTPGPSNRSPEGSVVVGPGRRSSKKDHRPHPSTRLNRDRNLFGRKAALLRPDDNRSRHSQRETAGPGAAVSSSMGWRTSIELITTSNKALS